MEKYKISPIDKYAAFCLIFMHKIAAVESKSLHWVSDCSLKTQNESYHGVPALHTA